MSRRSFVAGTASLPLLALSSRFGFAQAPAVTRFNAMGPKGQQMLVKYAKAVAKMQTPPTAEGKPISWLFQWYTHAVRADKTKAQEIARVYPAASPDKALAQDMWSTCQAHFNSANEQFFLPWHRMYVYYFERIIRGVLNDQDFTLPYWNYSAPDPAVHGIMPKQFRNPNSNVFKSLFRDNRNKPTGNQQIPNVNGGDPIDKFAPGALDLAALKQGTYLPSGALQGFNMSLDGGIHGAVHVLIGNNTNMGSVPWAARDAIFWMHHCNIDRLWASWCKNGGVNPGGAWAGKSFVFADENGNKVTKTCGEVDDIAKLGYTYEEFEPKPIVFAPITMTMTPVTPIVHVAATGITLGAAPVKKALEPKASPTMSAETPMTQRVASLKQGRRLYLVAKGLHADAQPGVLYQIYIDVPANKTPSPKDAAEHLAGTINFFDAAEHPDHEPAAPGGPERFVSFDVTEVARGLQQKGLLAPKPTLTIVPVGSPYGDAKPVVGEISIVEQ